MRYIPLDPKGQEECEEIGMNCKWEYEMVQLLWKTVWPFLQTA